MAGGGTSLEYTPTWILALVCTVILAISLAAERVLHYTGKFWVRKKQWPLFEALLKIKEELMLLGFISLLLTVFQDRISTICIPKHLTYHWLPCKKKTDSSRESTAHFQTSFFPPMVVVVDTFLQQRLMVLDTDREIRQWKQWEDSIQKKEQDPEGWHAYFWFAFVPLIWALNLSTLSPSWLKKLLRGMLLFLGNLWSSLLIIISGFIPLQLLHHGTSRLYNPSTCNRLLCSYSTLPLYAIVAQMGSSFNKAIFEDHIQAKLTGWVQKAKMKRGNKKLEGGSLIQVSNKESTYPVPSAPLGQEAKKHQGKSI